MLRNFTRWAAAIGLVLVLPRQALAQAYTFDSASSQSWTIAGMYAFSTGLGTTYTNPYTLAWDDTRQFPGSPSAVANNDPTGNSLGSLRISASNLAFPSNFPLHDTWVVDMSSPVVTNVSGWQNIHGVSFNLRCDDSSFVGNGRFLTSNGIQLQLLLAVTHKVVPPTSTYFIPTSYVGGSDFVSQAILTDNLTDVEQDPFHWMTVNARFQQDFSTYSIDRVIVRVEGSGPDVVGRTYGAFGCNVDNVQPIVTTTPQLGVKGTVTVARTTQCAGTSYTNDIDVQFNSDVAPSIRLSSAQLDFTNSNVQKGTYVSKSCDLPDEITESWGTGTRQLQLTPGYFVDEGEKFRHSEVLKRVSGSGNPVASDFAGATALLSFNGLPASCVVPLQNLTAVGTSRATATFTCLLPPAAPATSPVALGLMTLTLAGIGGFLSLRYRRRTA